MKTIALFLASLALTLAGCKKESNNALNLIEFDMDGNHYSLTPSDAYVTINTYQNIWSKSILITCTPQFGSAFAIGIGEDISDTVSNCIDPGIYPGNYPGTTCFDSIQGNCRNSSFIYSNLNLGVFSSTDYPDSTNVAHISSCTGSLPAVISGTFEAVLPDLTGVEPDKHITNGVIREVSIRRE